MKPTVTTSPKDNLPASVRQAIEEYDGFEEGLVRAAREAVEEMRRKGKIPPKK